MRMILLCPFDPVTEEEITYARTLLKESKQNKIYLMPWGRGVLSLEARLYLLETALKCFPKLEVLHTMCKDDVVNLMEGCEEGEEKARSGDFFLVPRSVRHVMLDRGWYFEEAAKVHCKASRFEHSKSVAQTAVMLAKAHHLDEEKAWKAGILHDITKNMAEEEARALIADRQPALLEMSPKVWHAYTAVLWIKTHLGPVGDDVLHAIEHHTLGDGLTDLDRILYIADKIEPLRGYDTSKETELAKRDLKKAAALVKKQSKEYILKTEGIHV